MTGREGSFHTEQMIKFGTQVIAGVTPGKGGQELLGVKIFNKIAEVTKQGRVDATVIFVPPAYCKAAILEAIDAEIPLIVTITEGMPIRDMADVVCRLRGSKSRMIGPNCPGITVAGEAKLGIMPNAIFKKGPVAIISRSGTLTYEILGALTAAGIGQSVCIGVGGDPILGSSFAELLPDLNADPQTKAIILLGEIGGRDEEMAAEFISAHGTKPVVAFISGRTAPEGKRMGHAGAIIMGKEGTAESKVSAFKRAGVEVVEKIYDIPAIISKRLIGK
jgi:succinyl-CoA synthetase alpha subunit